MRGPVYHSIPRPVWAAVLLVALIAVFPAVAWTQGGFPADRWMGMLFSQKPTALDQSLARFIFPGSHDAGTFALSNDGACDGCAGSDRFIDPVTWCNDTLPAGFDTLCAAGASSIIGLFGQAWGEAQHLTVGQQLNAGARYFDLRFFRATADDQTRTENRLQAGRFYIHHSLAGSELTPILNDIEGFVKADGHQQEIVILEFSQMKEGDESMPSESVTMFFDLLRERIGGLMAPKQDAACAGDPTCQATARFGHGTTLRDFLAQGSRVIVVCDCVEAPDVWSGLQFTSPYHVNTIDPSLGRSEGYPQPDDATYPWISDDQIVRMMFELSKKRDATPTEMFVLGVQFGLDECPFPDDTSIDCTDGTALIRSAACLVDALNVSGYCDAVNNDWDQFASLNEVADYTNPKTIAALARLRRDRVNIVAADHYNTAITEEVFKLNRGASIVETVIYGVDAGDDFDAVGNPADFYPIFEYPGVAPGPWGARVERNIYVPNNDRPRVRWPGWKAYPNEFATANVGLVIMDADDPPLNEDDRAAIDGGARQKFTSVPINGCVTNAASCLKPPPTAPLVTAGGPSDVDDKAAVFYTFNVCLWSWLPGDVFDPASLCGEAPPSVSITDHRQDEGSSGATVFPFVVTLSKPSPVQVQIKASLNLTGATATADDFFSTTPVTLTFAPGDTEETLQLEVNGDTTMEFDESFTVDLEVLSGAVLGDGSASGTIVNDDVPSLSITDVSMNEGNTGTKSFTFTVQLSEASLAPVTVAYTTTAGSATAGTDYTSEADTTLTFAVGETTKIVMVQVIGDYAVESDETFYVDLSNATGATLADSRGTGTIVNDDRPPTIVAPANQTGNEGANITFNLGTFSDDSPTAPWSITVNWGDGQSDTFDVSELGALSRSHTYRDNGVYTVGVSAADAGKASATAISFIATIANVNPTATLGNNGPINEGGSATVSFSGQTDPSSADTTAGFRYAFSCTNGSLGTATYASSGTTASTSCAFGDNAGGPFTVRGRIIDKDGGFTEYTTVLTVNNVAPTATLGNNGPVNEGAAATVTFTGQSDPSAADTTAGFRYAYSCTDGSLTGATYATASNTASTSCTFADNGTRTVRARIIDKDGGYTEYTTAVTVNNVPPSVTALGGTINEHGTATVSGNITDPGTLDSFTVTITWGDGTSSPLSLAAGATSYSATHQYLDDNPTATASDVASVSVSVTDKDNGTGTASTAVTINNVAPTLNAPVLEDETDTALGGIFPALRGLPVDLAAGFGDVGTLDTHTFQITWGDGTSSAGTAANGVAQATHTWSAVGSYQVTVQVTDDDTGTVSRQVTIEIVDTIGAVCGASRLLAPLQSLPLDSSTAHELTQVLGEIQGNIDGDAFNGACDMFEKSNWVAGLVKLDLAVGRIETILSGSTLGTAARAVLRQVQSRLILAAKGTYLDLARVSTNASKLAEAAARAQLAAAATAAGQPVIAIGHWVEAVRILAAS